ncbi:cell surface A33 antigen-like [Plectropomus leopardus]|uniref:cell surface A33 antigen-like n=1 Tax=Plectropomus leopardus TaxID=160734 RepID=UPI001C4CFB4E|nr:cell surface A33 antigen-like [Plectropomus leopardus]
MERRITTLTLLCLVLSGVGAINVNIPKEMYEYARGDNITLPCTFQPKATNPSLVIITWSSEAAAANAKENTIATYFSTGTTDISSQYEGRASLDVDVPTGKADLRLSSITLAENKVFECRVQIPGDDEGKPADTARVVVLVAPSKPICKIEGKAEYGQNINLTCKSEEGSPPPTYKWESRDVRNIPRVPDPRTTDKGGILSLFNISKEASGFYICTSANKIRSATCNVTLAVMPPSMNIGSTAGIIGGVVAALIVLIIIIYCCCCRKKEKKEEYAMGVREGEYSDKEPPRNGESRRADGEEDPRDYDDSSVRSPGGHSDRYEGRSERDYDTRRDYDDRRDYNDRRSDYNDRRSEYDDRRSDYDDRRSDYTDRRDYDDHRDRYSDRNDRYDDDRRYDDERYDDRRDRRRDDDDRYDEPYDDREHDRPPVPANKPKDYEV